MLLITSPPEVVVEVTPTEPPVVLMTYAVGPQGPPGPTVPPNQLPVATGTLDLGNNRLTGLSAPVSNTDAVNSTYLDSRFAVLIDDLKPGPITQTKATVSEDFALTSGFNGMSVGPVTIEAGKTVTVPVNSTWVIL